MFSFLPNFLISIKGRVHKISGLDSLMMGAAHYTGAARYTGSGYMETLHFLKTHASIITLNNINHTLLFCLL